MPDRSGDGETAAGERDSRFVRHASRRGRLGDRWGQLDLHGWVERHHPQCTYAVVPVDDGPVGFLPALNWLDRHLTRGAARGRAGP